MQSLTYKQIQDKNLWILDLEDIEKETSKLIIRNRINNKMFSSSKKKFVKNDVLYGKLRPYLDKVLIADEDGICTTEIVPIRIYKDILPEYLRYILKSPFFLHYVNNLTYGVKMPRLGTDDAENALLPIPPLSEQKKIVNILNSTINAIENITLDKEALANVMKQTKAKVLDLAIKGKLVQQDPNDEPADKLLEKIREEKEKLIKEGKLKRDKNETFIFKNSDDNSYYEQKDDEVVCIDDDLPFEIPNSWRWCRLKDIGTIVGGGTPKTDIKENWENGNIPWLTPADMRNVKSKYVKCGERNITLQGYNSSSTIMLSPNSIVYSSRAPIGYVAITQNSLCTNQGFKSVDLYCKECSNYTYYLLKALTADIVNRASGTTFKEISGSEFGQTFVPIPPLNEQIKIGEKIDDIFQYLDNLESIIKGS